MQCCIVIFAYIRETIQLQLHLPDNRGFESYWEILVGCCQAATNRSRHAAQQLQMLQDKVCFSWDRHPTQPHNSISTWSPENCRLEQVCFFKICLFLGVHVVCKRDCQWRPCNSHEHLTTEKQMLKELHSPL